MCCHKEKLPAKPKKLGVGSALFTQDPTIKTAISENFFPRQMFGSVTLIINYSDLQADLEKFSFLRHLIFLAGQEDKFKPHVVTRCPSF
jgi:hypothetical protein